MSSPYHKEEEALHSPSLALPDETAWPLQKPDFQINGLHMALSRQQYIRTLYIVFYIYVTLSLHVPNQLQSPWNDSLFLLTLLQF